MRHTHHVFLHAAHILVYTYDPTRIYLVRTMAGSITDLALAHDETPQTLALGDTIRWITARTAHDVFIKPVRSGLVTSATLVTNLHRYELLLVSVAPGHSWDAEVRWRTDRPLIVFHDPSLAALPSASPPRHRRIDPLDVETRFVMHGRASWRPVEVYSLGARTYIVFRRHTHTLPAFFLVEGKRTRLANYTVRGRTLIYPGRLRKALLVLGRQRVIIQRTRR